jgi:hypothetical protein
VEKIKPFLDAGFTGVALVQIGAGQQEPFIRWAEREPLPALRALWWAGRERHNAGETDSSPSHTQGALRMTPG